MNNPKNKTKQRNVLKNYDNYKDNYVFNPLLPKIKNDTLDFQVADDVL